ncbi:MAG: hypothetical protein HY843_06990 [Bdellovibrio sp.]|nr:hypothetical protein [Bdellovibrio sp.]
MLALAHIGIGTKLLGPFSKGLSKSWIIFGIFLPDIIDKPLYYIPVFFTGKWGAEFGLISGTRTFGHTGLLLLLIVFLAILNKSKILTAIALGHMTHLALDNWIDRFNDISPVSAKFALFFPAYGFQFPIIPHGDKWRYLASYADSYILSCEAIGLLIILWDYWKWRHRKEIFRLSQKKHSSAV